MFATTPLTANGAGHASNSVSPRSKDSKHPEAAGKARHCEHPRWLLQTCRKRLPVFMGSSSVMKKPSK